MGRLRIATRSSRQATTQASIVAARLRENGFPTELVLIETYGDQTQAQDVPLHSIGGQGVFVTAVQQAVLDGRAELAVHSAKDLPTEQMPGLTIGAFTTRRNPADALVGLPLDRLGVGATVATGSVRRRAQIARARSDLNFVELRGNIDTRLARLPSDGAVVVAVAALEVLDLTEHIAQVLDPTVFVPAVGQGCVAVEHRSDDGATAASMALIDDAPTRAAVEVERSFLRQLGTGCSAPVGAYVNGRELWTFLAGADSTDADSTDAAHREPAVTKHVLLSGDIDADQRTAARLAEVSLVELGIEQ